MYSTLHLLALCGVWSICVHCVVCIGLFICFQDLFLGERVVKCFFFSSNIDMIVIHVVFIIYVILFL